MEARRGGKQAEGEERDLGFLLPPLRKPQLALHSRSKCAREIEERFQLLPPIPFPRRTGKKTIAGERKAGEA